MSRLLLDTGVFIRAERTRASLDAIISDDDDVCLATISVAELLEGVERADAARRPAREAFVDAILRTVPVEDYTVPVARTHARLLTYTRSDGVPRGAHDLIVAATALATGRELITTDSKAGFDAIPGLTVYFLPAQ